MLAADAHRCFSAILEEGGVDATGRRAVTHFNESRRERLNAQSAENENRKLIEHTNAWLGLKMRRWSPALRKTSIETALRCFATTALCDGELVRYSQIPHRPPMPRLPFGRSSWMSTRT